MPREETPLVGAWNTANAPESTNRDSRFQVPANITWPVVEYFLLRQRPFPDRIPADILASQKVSAHKWPYASHGMKLGIAPECRQAFIDSVMAEVAQGEPVTGSVVRPFAPRGLAFVPQDKNDSCVPLSFIVPTGYQWWLEAYSFDLFPSTSNELNYAWRILINGQDVLNANDQSLIFGRPQRDNRVVVIGSSKETQKVAFPGDEVQVVVQAAAAVPSSDRVAATLFGNLEPAV